MLDEYNQNNDNDNHIIIVNDQYYRQIECTSDCV